MGYNEKIDEYRPVRDRVFSFSFERRKKMSQVYKKSEYYGPAKKKYGFFKFLFDVFMVCITAGFWFIWIFVREMRK